MMASRRLARSSSPAAMWCNTETPDSSPWPRRQSAANTRRRTTDVTLGAERGGGRAQIGAGQSSVVGERDALGMAHERAPGLHDADVVASSVRDGATLSPSPVSVSKAVFQPEHRALWSKAKPYRISDS